MLWNEKGKSGVVWGLVPGHPQDVSGLFGAWDPGAIIIGEWVRRKGLTSGIVGLLVHYPFT